MGKDKNKLVIAIDGPAGSGKSTIAKKVAQELGCDYFDTGALYRYITLKALEQGIDFGDVSKLAELTQHLDYSQIPYDKIRNNEISKNVSLVAKIPEVRHNLIPYQREVASRGGLVMEGRDIGSVILPDADVKIFLTASIEERAKRRFIELQQEGYAGTIAEIEQEIAQRDRLDSERKTNPLKVAEGAVILDTSNLSIPEVVREIKKIAQEKLAKNE